jgi:UrcA family protein
MMLCLIVISPASGVFGVSLAELWPAFMQAKGFLFIVEPGSSPLGDRATQKPPLITIGDTFMKTNSSTRKGFDFRILVLTGVVAACLHPALVRAADAARDSDPVKKTVTYADLNLANPRGVERLYGRIVSAAHDVCESSGDRSMVARLLAVTCTRDAINHAVAAVNQPPLTALHAQKTGQVTPARLLAQQ